jgi:hypothetical protein
VVKYPSGSELYELSYLIQFCNKVLKYPSRFELYELSYWIQFCNKVLKYPSGSKFYELSYWIQFCSKVLKYPTGYLEFCVECSTTVLPLLTGCAKIAKKIMNAINNFYTIRKYIKTLANV